MATGKPIVSTPVRDVVRQWSDIVRLATTAEEFVAAADQALRAGPGDERVARGIALAKANSWDNAVDQMRTLIASALEKRAKHPAPRIEPLSETELAYAYRSTQGS
jgi:UDP-galactopyranose mutase